MTMVFDGRWKLVEYLDPDEGQLFDLDTDPNEERDLWNEPQHADIRQDLLGRIARWRAESAMTAATWPAPFR